MYDKIYDVPVPTHRAINAIAHLEETILPKMYNALDYGDLALLTEVQQLFIDEKADLMQYAKASQQL